MDTLIIGNILGKEGDYEEEERASKNTLMWLRNWIWKKKRFGEYKLKNLGGDIV